jgi:hypothetical protein
VVGTEGHGHGVWQTGNIDDPVAAPRHQAKTGRTGVAHALGADFARVQNVIPQTVAAHDVLSLPAKVPPALLQELVFSENPTKSSTKERNGAIADADTCWSSMAAWLARD